MDASKLLRSASQLCNASAATALKAQLALGARPAAPAEAALWDQKNTRLRGQILSLTELAPKLAAASVLQGLSSLQGDLDTLTTITKEAEAKIKKIAEVSELLTQIGKVLDLGVAILIMAASPSADNAEKVVAAVKKLASDD